MAVMSYARCSPESTGDQLSGSQRVKSWKTPRELNYPSGFSVLWNIVHTDNIYKDWKGSR